jgi:RNA polymerase sigma-70 factor (ECF subfamily)
MHSKPNNLLPCGRPQPRLCLHRTLIPHYQQADEVLQRVAVTLVRSEQYDPTRPFRWAVGVAKASAYFRRERATDKRLATTSRTSPAGTSCLPKGSIRFEIASCLRELKGRSKRVIELRYRSGMRSNVIADEMSLSPGAVRMLLCRVREKLRHCIERRTAAQNRASIG